MPSISVSDPWVQNLIYSAIALVAIWVLFFLLSKVFERAIQDKLWRHKTRKFTFYAGVGASIVALLIIWVGDGGQIAITFSVIGAGLALALQQPLVSMAGWVYIVTNHPYDIGDRIEINGVSGDVVDIKFLKTVLFESYLEGTAAGTQTTGRVVDIPNADVLMMNVFNYTRGFEYVWNEYPILITFESNWEKAYKILSEIMKDEAERFEAPAMRQVSTLERRYLIYDEKMISEVYVMIKDSGIELGMRYISPARRRRMIRDQISRRALAAFNEQPDIELAYPTYRIFRREIEEANTPLRNKSPE